jgi:predicted ArsR family transcriptional regulator
LERAFQLELARRTAVAAGRDPDSIEYTRIGSIEMTAERVDRSTSDIAKVIGLTPRAIRTRLAKLIDRGLLREVGTSPTRPKRRYFSAG